jgi:polyketide cyclase/dehydrase/lipid transport protein
MKSEIGVKRVVRASKSALISAPSRTVYSLIADYRNGHPRMLPRRYFPRLEVERGGLGAGTIIRFEVKLLGTTRRIRAEISEPTPGEELVETDLATGARTSFIVTSRGGGHQSEVTIKTEWEAKGLRGWLERMTAPPLLRRIYAEELAQLGTLFAAGSSAATHGPS